MLRKFPIFLFLLFTLHSTAFAATVPPLFQWMQGDWKGEGQRTYPRIGQKVLVSVTVHSHIEGDQLISENTFQETPIGLDGQPQPVRQYQRIYWLRLKAGTSDEYELGSGSGADEKVGSQGKLTGAELRVVQEIPGQPPFVVDSVTDFHGTETDYHETTYFQGQINTDTVLHYSQVIPKT